jgi:S-formylglutathione hydrolase FrmB
MFARALLFSIGAWLALSLLADAQSATPAAAAPPTANAFKIQFDAKLEPKPYSGRVYVALTTKPGQEPRLQMGDWFGGNQVLAQDVEELAQGGTVTIDDSSLGFPHELADLGGGEYFVQAVARRSLDSPKPGEGAGDLYSKPVKIRFAPGDEKAGAIVLALTETVVETPFQESDRVKYFEMVSPSLSKFHGREMKLRAGVVLPAGPAGQGPQPTVYFITGFGGDHRNAQWLGRMIPAGSNVLLVVPDPTCALGHSVFADSANNGPWGQALVNELIPAVEKQFQGAQNPARRYVTGISSGGWSSLWLQITYPDVFNGCWSHCPDPVDLRDFQRIDLYAKNANLYRDEHGERRALARLGGDVRLWYDDFVRQETVMGPGGQIHSFEAVFSARDAEGNPELMFDRETGSVNPTVAKSWEKYDIRLVLERSWQTLGPKLAHKLHIYAGGVDTFYLEGAVKLLQQSLTALGSDAEVLIVPGMPHTIYQPGMDAMFKTIAAQHD